MFVLIVIFCFILSFMIWVVGNMLSKSMEKDKEKGGVYECGFESFYMARVPFSLQFFLIGVIFLIFDVEIVLMLPMILLSDVNLIESVYFFLFVLLLLGGLYYEWKEGALEWYN
uniref:NADH-ubiquinone oxidoreductase chain 3 n=1 Tax=Tityus serrulatus TaxID=6887 RepID=A0A0K1LX65_TITSE|nr:NADH dehydrogenase subunit 3 [Tityus serrulatus]AKU46795.1 NADH dehydrogenase subunit 3 [Tityus serrulatus]